ncbi:hypothetical protein TcCL_NonESM06616 [Trypanosoma cruzi]|nr:hypothetical protein TcCL_NonESM06616 [Trypanosoma cruzi]
MVISPSLGSALQNKQRHHTRTALHKERMKKHGGRTQSRETSVQINCTVRLARRPPDRGCAAAARCVCPQWLERILNGKRDAVRPSSISVDCHTGDVIPSDRPQQRQSPSAEVGAFLLKLGCNSTNAAARPSFTNTTRKQQREIRHVRRARSRGVPLLPP